MYNFKNYSTFIYYQHMYWPTSIYNISPETKPPVFTWWFSKIFSQSKIIQVAFLCEFYRLGASKVLWSNTPYTVICRQKVCFSSLNLTLRRLLYIIAYLKVLHFIIIFKHQMVLLEYKIRFLIYYLWVFYRKTKRKNLSLEIHYNNVKKLLNSRQIFLFI